MTYGTPLHIKTNYGPRIGIAAGPLPPDRTLVWVAGRLRVVPLSMAQPWTCPTCGGGRIWWSLTHEPACATCAPIPSAVYEAAWQGAVQFIEALAEGTEDADRKAILRQTLDQAVSSGDLRELLRLCMVHEVMKWEITRRRKHDDTQHGGTP